MPSLWTRDERKTLEARGQATRERMMRELTVALETVASDVPLILKLEDIHWRDVSTIDWLGHVARRPDPARLMILATFRPADAAAKKANLHALVTELVLHGCCREIELNPLSLKAIESYLKARRRRELRLCLRTLRRCCSIGQGQSIIHEQHRQPACPYKLGSAHQPTHVDPARCSTLHRSPDR
jgi:hypothetical protein